MEQSIEEWRSQSAAMSTSTGDVFRINPPKTFCYTDFVIRAPNPRVPRGMNEEEAKIKYPRSRLKRLMRVVEARLGKNRCYFSECQPRDKKKDTQFEITNLYALYEVEHWPDALAQYEWTQFVIANMERDATREQVGYIVKLALPMLPASALPMYQEMMHREGLGRAKVATQPGQINGCAFGGQYRGYSLEDPRRHELHDRATENHLLRQSLSTSQLPTSQVVHGSKSNDPLGYTNPQSQEMAPLHQACVSTDNFEDFATLDERDRQESTLLTTEMLPLAAQAPTIAPHVEEQSQAQVESHTTPSHLQAQEQTQPAIRTQIPESSRSEILESTPPSPKLQHDGHRPANLQGQAPVKSIKLVMSQALRVLGDESSLPSNLREASREETSTLDPAELAEVASDSGLLQTEAAPSPPADTTKHEPTIEIITPNACKAQSKAKATKATQKSNQATHKVSNITTRLAKQKIEEQSRRSLRSLPHRDVSK